MNDDADPTFGASINQMAEGHEWIFNTFGEVPRYGWHIGTEAMGGRARMLTISTQIPLACRPTTPSCLQTWASMAMSSTVSTTPKRINGSRASTSSLSGGIFLFI